MSVSRQGKEVVTDRGGRALVSVPRKSNERSTGQTHAKFLSMRRGGGRRDTHFLALLPAAKPSGPRTVRVVVVVVVVVGVVGGSSLSEHWLAFYYTSAS